MTAAAAWREVVAALGDGDGLWPRRVAVGTLSPELEMVLAMLGDPGIDLEGGKELRSGAIVGLLYEPGWG